MKVTDTANARLAAIEAQLVRIEARIEEREAAAGAMLAALDKILGELSVRGSIRADDWRVSEAKDAFVAALAAGISPDKAEG